ncbi:hypothetical protein A2U01_0048255, partial [Trifolium medium]|nr:hypothetical protein [Trifolium medium]
MVPAAPETDLYKPRKRKRNTSEDQEEEPEKKEIKKETVTTSESVKEKFVKEKVDQKAEVVIVEKSLKKDKKRKSHGIKIDEGRSKLRHDKRSKEDESTESDDVPLAQRLKHKTSEAYGKDMHNKFSS